MSQPDDRRHDDRDGGISQLQFYNGLGDVNARIDAHVKDLTVTMAAQFDRVFRKMDEHASEDARMFGAQRELAGQIANRVLTIENSAAADEKAKARQDTWNRVYAAGGIAGAGAAIWSLIERHWLK